MQMEWGEGQRSCKGGFEAGGEAMMVMQGEETENGGNRTFPGKLQQGRRLETRDNVIVSERKGNVSNCKKRTRSVVA